MENKNNTNNSLEAQQRLNKNKTPIVLNQDVKGVGKKGRKGWVVVEQIDLPAIIERRHIPIFVEFEGNINIREVYADFFTVLKIK